MILAIDPGPKQSAWVLWRDGGRNTVADFRKQEPNSDLLERILGYGFEGIPAVCVVEKIEAMGMTVGASVFETVFWTGRLAQAWNDDNSFARIGRREIKLHLCGTARAQDKNIRAALIDKFGGSKEAAIGKKATPGPLYGISSHAWAALAVAVTWEETRSGM